MAEETILTSLQTNVLKTIIKDKFFTSNFYFSGGTALAEFYLRHRYSDDLDFFTKKEISYQSLLRKLQPKFDQMGIDTFEYREQAGMKIFLFKQHGKKKLKVDSNYFPFPNLKPFTQYRNLNIDSLFDITINKINLILTRKNIRDYVDLYFIQNEKQYLWEKLFKGVKEKYSWEIDKLNFASQLLSATELEDYPKLIKPFSKQKMINYYQNQAKNLKSEILA